MKKGNWNWMPLTAAWGTSLGLLAGIMVGQVPMGILTGLLLGQCIGLFLTWRSKS